MSAATAGGSCGGVWATWCAATCAAIFLASRSNTSAEHRTGRSRAFKSRTRIVSGRLCRRASQSRSLERSARMESCAQYRVLFELALVDVDQFPNGFFGRFVVGMEQLQHVGILPNDFAVGAAPLSRGACGSQALRKAGSGCAFQKSCPILRRDDAIGFDGAEVKRIVNY